MAIVVVTLVLDHLSKRGIELVLLHEQVWEDVVIGIGRHAAGAVGQGVFREADSLRLGRALRGVGVHDAGAGQDVELVGKVGVGVQEGIVKVGAVG